MPDPVLGPSLDLQLALVAIWKADAGLTTLMGSRTWLFSDVQRDAVFPYVVIGDGQDEPDTADCIDGSEVFMDLHIWTDKGKAECKKVVAALLAALPDEPPDLTQNTCVLLERRTARYMTDSNPNLKHGVLTLRALTEPA